MDWPSTLRKASTSSSGPMQLRVPYSFWYSERKGRHWANLTGAPGTNGQTFEDNVVLVGTLNTVEDFWAHYSHLAPAGEIPVLGDYHFFKGGVKPIWEDEENKLGGKWIVRIKKGLASRYWENLLLAIIGEQFDVDDEICGAVISIRYNEDIISVWNKSASKSDVTMKIRDTMKRILALPASVHVEYKTHDTSLRDKSSFRNTSLF